MREILEEIRKILIQINNTYSQFYKESKDFKNRQDIDEKLEKMFDRNFEKLSKIFDKVMQDLDNLSRYTNIISNRVDGFLSGNQNLNRVINSLSRYLKEINESESYVKEIIDKNKGKYFSWLDDVKNSLDRIRNTVVTRLTNLYEHGEEARRYYNYYSKVPLSLSESISKNRMFKFLFDTEEFKENVKESLRESFLDLRRINIGRIIFGSLKRSAKSFHEILSSSIISSAEFLYKYFKNFLDVLSDSITSVRRIVGLTLDNAAELYRTYSNMVLDSSNVFINTKNILQANTELNRSLSVGVSYWDQNKKTSFDILSGYAKLKEFYGLSAEQASRIASLAIIHSTTTEKIINQSVEELTLLKSQTGAAMSYSDALKEAASYSGIILTTFNDSIPKIATAVAEMQRLGITMSQVSSIRDHMLNFQSSIEAQLKAELFTGRQINLERARALALNNDYLGLAKEIARQVGTEAEFRRYNYLVQQSLAQAFGMSVDQMADMLRKQELFSKLGVDVTKNAQEALKVAKEKGISLSEEVRQQLEALSLEQQRKATMDRLKDTLNTILSGPGQEFLKLFNWALEKVVAIEKTLHNIFRPLFGSKWGEILLTVGGIGMGAAAYGVANRATFANIFNKRGYSPLNPLYVKDVGGLTALGGTGFLKSGDIFGKTLSMIGVGVASEALKSILPHNQLLDSGINVAGSAAQGAILGSIFGPVGTGIGAALGGIYGILHEISENTKRQREIAEEQARKQEEDNRKLHDALNNLAIRPVELSVNNKTILDFNTASQQYGNYGSYFV